MLSPPQRVHARRRAIRRQTSRDTCSTATSPGPSAHPSLALQGLGAAAYRPVEAAAGAATEVGRPEVAVRPGLEGGRRGGGASCVAAQLDVGLRGLDVVDHGAELVDETHQGHVHALADGLAGGGEIAVECVVVAPVEVVEGEGSGGGALWRAGRLLHHHGVHAEGLDEQSWFELQGREVHHALPADASKCK